MTESASTPRLRATFAIYLALIATAAVVGPREVSPFAYYASGILGFLCVALACLGRIWTSVFIAGHKDLDLVTRGPYALCRHPLYACSMLGALGLGLSTRSPLLCVAVVLLISALVVYAASCEEQFLADAFPEEFKAYLAATPNKWWPGPRREPLPERLDVQPSVLWKAFVDAGSFFLLYLLVLLATEYRLGAAPLVLSNQPWQKASVLPAEVVRADPYLRFCSRQRYSRTTRHFEQSLAVPSRQARSSPLRAASG